MNTRDYLRGLMKRYTVDHLVGITEKDFRKRISEFLAMDDYKMEGYQSPDAQRTLSTKFHWGHNHDFGTFKLKGRMGDRHIEVLAEFIDHYGLPKDLTGKKVLDVGVWTGGTSLLLYAMNAWSVVAFEEVKKYVDCAKFIADSFGIALMFYDKSLYTLPASFHGWTSFFDYIIFPGVLYHLTDPVLALRILFNCLKDGGTLFIESAAQNDNGQRTLLYSGPTEPGWNWFIPTRDAIMRMCIDVGFSKCEMGPVKNGRVSGYAYKKEQVDMLRAGLSRRDVG